MTLEIDAMATAALESVGCPLGAELDTADKTRIVEVLKTAVEY
jgi:hypothetical protein